MDFLKDEDEMLVTNSEGVCKTDDRGRKAFLDLTFVL